VPTDTMPLHLGQAALQYAARSLRVFPLWHTIRGVCVCHDGPACGNPGKHPRTRYGVMSASNDEDTVTQWWRRWPDANIGLPAGDNGLAVIDVDPRHGGDLSLSKLATWCLDRHNIDLMATRVIRTGSGGLHLYFRQPPGGIKTGAKSFAAPGLDTRGRGGYVIAPPSVHASGQHYETIDDRPPARWPMILTDLMNPRRPAQQTAQAAARGTQGARTRWAQAALTAECDALRALPAAEGNGKNQALNVAAYKLGRRIAAGYLDDDTVTDALLDVARGWPGHGERELVATIRSGIDAGKRNPHPGPTTREAGA
jgi:hypothetical protein